MRKHRYKNKEKSIRDQRSDRWSNHIKSVKQLRILRREVTCFKSIIPTAVLKISCRKIRIES